MAHLRYAELSGYCRNENASSVPLSPRELWEVPSASVWQPDHLPKETRGFASPPHDGFAFFAEHQRRCAHATCSNTETSEAVKGGTKGRAPALGAAVASIHPVAEKAGVPGNPYAAHRIVMRLDRSKGSLCALGGELSNTTCSAVGYIYRQPRIRQGSDRCLHRLTGDSLLRPKEKNL
jgi:hypothetical protein